MYPEFFGFREKPFKLIPESANFYCSATHERATTMLEYGINSRKGFMLLYGLPGTGRTTLCLLLKETLANCNVVYLPKSPDNDLLYSVCFNFGIKTERDATENAYFGQMIEFFVDEYKKGKNNLIIVDDADNYSIDVFRTLEKLAEVEIEQCKLVQVLLVGTQELCSKLLYGNIKNLNERVLSVTELGLMGLNDTANYLQHRIRLAKCQDPDVLKRTAVIEIHRYSHGLPLEINLVADKAFQIAADSKDSKVGTKHIRKAIKQLSGINPPLRIINIAQYLTPLLVVLVIILGAMQLKTYFNSHKAVQKTAAAPVQQETVTEKTAEHAPKPAPEASEETEQAAAEPQPSVTEPAVTEEAPEPAVTASPEPTAATELAASTPEPEKVAAAAASSPVKYGCITALSGLNMRNAPHTDAEVVSVVPSGGKIILIEKSGKWWLAEYNATQGYLFSSFVSEDLADCSEN
jgi:general secretion pathway protein A